VNNRFLFTKQFYYRRDRHKPVQRINNSAHIFSPFAFYAFILLRRSVSICHIRKNITKKLKLFFIPPQNFCGGNKITYVAGGNKINPPPLFQNGGG